MNTPVEGAYVASMSLETSATAVKMATSMLQLGVGLVCATRQVRSKSVIISVCTIMYMCVMFYKLLALFELQGPTTQVHPVIQ